MKSNPGIEEWRSKILTRVLNINKQKKKKISSINIEESLVILKNLDRESKS